MPAPYLGKIRYKWCDHCGVPILRGKTCPKCNAPLREVEVSPPGEVKPLFPEEMGWIKSIIDESYGKGVGDAFFSDEKIVLINKAPGEDRVDEIIIRGKIYGVLRYDLRKRKNQLLFHPVSFGRLKGKISRHYVMADRGAVPFILQGRNLMKPGVLDCSEDIEVNDYVVVVDEEMNIIASGVAKATSDEIDKGKGVAVKVKYYGTIPEPPPSSDWDTFLEVNAPIIASIEAKSINEIKKIVEKYNLPVVVSFSGGKDSIVALSLTKSAGIPFETVFLDTGIEFPQTVDYVKKVSETLGVEITVINSGKRFWKGVEYFGPPARDYRWCCKLVKTGPITRYFVTNYPNGALTIIGQRKYESSTRKHAGKVWRNPWTPKQISYSPIQEWSSLEVWAYIMLKNLPINELYKRGFYRIGCYLCPAGEAGDWERIREVYPEGYGRWRKILSEYFDNEWIDVGAWRWRRLPSFMREIVKKEYKITKSDLKITSKGMLGDKMILELNKNVMYVVDRVLHPLGNIEKVEDGYVVGNTFISSNKIVGPQDDVKEAFELIKRGMECVGCGVCLGYCPTGALVLENDEKIRINPEKCVKCKKCLGVCPIIKFR